MNPWILLPFLSLAALITFFNNTDTYSYFLTPKPEIENQKLKLDEPLVIDFDHPVIHHKIESSFSISPQTIGKMEWRDNKLVFTPVNPWKPDANYKVGIRGITATTADYSYENIFQTEDLPKIKSYSPAPGNIIGLKGPVKIDLDKSASGCHLDFTIAPEVDYDLEIDEDRQSFKIIPKGNFEQDASYQVIAYLSYVSPEDKLWHRKELTNFFFKTIPPPKFVDTNPLNKEEDVKNFRPIKVRFSKPMVGKEWQDYIEIFPKVAGKVESEEGGKTLVFKPNRWKDNTSYNVKVKSGLKAQDGTYLKEGIEFTFHTIDSSGFTHNRTANENPYIKEGKYIDINLSQQLLGIFNDGINLGSYKVSTGKRGMQTPTGSYKVMNKNLRKWSRKYKLYMPYWMQFTGVGHGIHELPEWPGGHKEGANHLGIPVSHGCVRLGIGAAETVYQWSPVGTLVYIHY